MGGRSDKSPVWGILREYLRSTLRERDSSQSLDARFSLPIVIVIVDAHAAQFSLPIVIVDAHAAQRTHCHFCGGMKLRPRIFVTMSKSFPWVVKCQRSHSS